MKTTNKTVIRKALSKSGLTRVEINWYGEGYAIKAYPKMTPELILEKRDAPQHFPGCYRAYAAERIAEINFDIPGYYAEGEHIEADGGYTFNLIPITVGTMLAYLNFVRSEGGEVEFCLEEAIYRISDEEVRRKAENILAGLDI